jgi:hypothetical protein
VHEAGDGRYVVTAPGRDNLLDRAERLLYRCSEPACSVTAVATGWPLRPFFWTRGRVGECPPKSAAGEPASAPSPKDQRLSEHTQVTALLVEHRDEVVARIATDMAKSGMRVIRAKSSAEARPHREIYEPALVVINVDLIDENGWLLATKLRPSRP